MNKIIPVWTILFIVKENDEKAVECLKDWAIKYLNMKILTDFPSEDVLTILAEKVPDQLESTAKKEHPEINAAQVIKSCLDEILFHQFVQRGIKEMKKTKEEQRMEEGAGADEEEDGHNEDVDGNESEFSKFYIGLRETTAEYVNLTGPTRLSHRLITSECLQKYVDNEIKYNADQFLDGLCRDVSVGENEIEAGAAENFIRKCLGKDDAHLFDDYKNIGLKKIPKRLANRASSVSTNLNFFLFKIGLCSTEEFKPFSELRGLERMATMKCLETCGGYFMQKFEHLREDQSNTKQSESSKIDNSGIGKNGINFVGECVENGAKSIEDITSLGVEKLIVYDRAYLNMFILQAKKIHKNYSEVEKLHISFEDARRIYESCTILLCEACKANDSEIPFYSWLNDKALMGKEVETVKASYKKKKHELKNQSIDQVYEHVQAMMEQDAENQIIYHNFDE